MESLTIVIWTIFFVSALLRIYTFQRLQHFSTFHGKSYREKFHLFKLKSLQTDMCFLRIRHHDIQIYYLNTWKQSINDKAKQI